METTVSTFLGADGGKMCGCGKWSPVRLLPASLRLRGVALRLRAALPPFPASLLSVGEAPSRNLPVPAECEDAEAGDLIHLAFSPCGFPVIHGALVTRAPLQFRTPGDPSEPPFSQGLCLHPLGHVRGRGRPEQQQQPPRSCAHRPAGSPRRSRQGEVGGIPVGSGRQPLEVPGAVVGG